jgi:hypothetical protein
MRPKSFLVMITKSNEEEQPGQKGDDDDPDGSSGKKFEVKMFWAKKPRGGSAKNASTDLRSLGCVDLSHYKCHKSR